MLKRRAGECSYGNAHVKEPMWSCEFEKKINVTKLKKRNQNFSLSLVTLLCTQHT